jgi:glycine cleavage system regulatory protein
MRDMLVLTINGPDRTGLVESLAAQISAVGGNWEESRMARLAGQFAGILLVTVDTARTDELVAALRGRGVEGVQVTGRGTEGLQVTVRTTKPTTPPATSTRVRLQLTGQDRSGIVRDVSRLLVERGINIEQRESEVVSAPMSGERMFTARIELLVPAKVTLGEVRACLESLASELMVDLAAA